MFFGDRYVYFEYLIDGVMRGGAESVRETLDSFGSYFYKYIVFNRCGSGKNPAGGGDIATYRWYEELPVGAR